MGCDPGRGRQIRDHHVGKALPEQVERRVTVADAAADAVVAADAVAAAVASTPRLLPENLRGSDQIVTASTAPARPVKTIPGAGAARAPRLPAPRPAFPSVAPCFARTRRRAPVAR